MHHRLSKAKNKAQSRQWAPLSWRILVTEIEVGRNDAYERVSDWMSARSVSLEEE